MAGSKISVRMDWHSRSNIGAGWYHGQGRYGGDGIIYDGTDGRCNLIACLASSFPTEWAKSLLFQVDGFLSSWGWLIWWPVNLQ